MKTQTQILTSTLKTPPHRPALRGVDLSRGARQFGLRSPVSVDARVLAEYVELDPALGLNVPGILLTLLVSELLLNPGGGAADCLTACLARQADGRAVEVDLAVEQRRHLSGEAYHLHRRAERDLWSSGSER